MLPVNDDLRIGRQEVTRRDQASQLAQLPSRVRLRGHLPALRLLHLLLPPDGTVPVRHGGAVTGPHRGKKHGMSATAAEDRLCGTWLLSNFAALLDFFKY